LFGFFVGIDTATFVILYTRGKAASHLPEMHIVSPVQLSGEAEHAVVPQSLVQLDAVSLPLHVPSPQNGPPTGQSAAQVELVSPALQTASPQNGPSPPSSSVAQPSAKQIAPQISALMFIASLT
jgi:hypothetical protein